jgi:hypothetical protein
MPGWSTDLQQAAQLGACASLLAKPAAPLSRALLRCEPVPPAPPQQPQPCLPAASCAPPRATPATRPASVPLAGLAKRPAWLAAHTLPAEDSLVARLHASLRSRHRGLLTLLTPAALMDTAAGGRASAAAALAEKLRGWGLDLHVALLSAVAGGEHREWARHAARTGVR